MLAPPLSELVWQLLCPAHPISQSYLEVFGMSSSLTQMLLMLSTVDKTEEQGKNHCYH